MSESNENEEIIKDHNKVNFPKYDINKLTKEFPNRFLLASAVAKRARQISEGEKPLIDFVQNKPYNPISIALKELEQGLISIAMKESIDDEIELIDKLDKNLDSKISKQEKEEKAKTTPDKSKKKRSLFVS